RTAFRRPARSERATRRIGGHLRNGLRNSGGIGGGGRESPWRSDRSLEGASRSGAVLLSGRASSPRLRVLRHYALPVPARTAGTHRDRSGGRARNARNSARLPRRPTRGALFGKLWWKDAVAGRRWDREPWISLFRSGLRCLPPQCGARSWPKPPACSRRGRRSWPRTMPGGRQRNGSRRGQLSGDPEPLLSQHYLVPGRLTGGSMYCPRCLTEYREGFAECVDCRIPLAAGPPPPPSKLHELGPQRKAAPYLHIGPSATGRGARFSVRHAGERGLRRHIRFGFCLLMDAALTYFPRFGRQRVGGLVFQLCGKDLDHLRKDLHARPMLVVPLHRAPGRRARAGLEQHLFHGLPVKLPLVAVAPVFVGELPGFVADGPALLEALQLLLARDVDPELGQDRAKVAQLPLEGVDLPERALPFLLARETLH